MTKQNCEKQKMSKKQRNFKKYFSSNKQPSTETETNASFSIYSALDYSVPIYADTNSGSVRK